MYCPSNIQFLVTVANSFPREGYNLVPSVNGATLVPMPLTTTLRHFRVMSHGFHAKIKPSSVIWQIIVDFG